MASSTTPQSHQFANPPSLNTFPGPTIPPVSNKTNLFINQPSPIENLTTIHAFSANHINEFITPRLNAVALAKHKLEQTCNFATYSIEQKMRSQIECEAAMSIGRVKAGEGNLSGNGSGPGREGKQFIALRSSKADERKRKKLRRKKREWQMRIEEAGGELELEFESDAGADAPEVESGAGREPEPPADILGVTFDGHGLAQVRFNTWPRSF